jgi:hypothetical protein
VVSMHSGQLKSGPWLLQSSQHVAARWRAPETPSKGMDALGFDQKKLNNNFMSWMNELSDRDKEEGGLWYPTGNDWGHHAAELYQQHPDKVFGVMSKTSPQRAWYANLADTENVVSNHRHTPENIVKPGGVSGGNNLQQALRVMDADDDPESIHSAFLGTKKVKRKGQPVAIPRTPRDLPKTYDFMRTLRDPEEGGAHNYGEQPGVVDSWMSRSMLWPKEAWDEAKAGGKPLSWPGKGTGKGLDTPKPDKKVNPHTGRYEVVGTIPPSARDVAARVTGIAGGYDRMRNAMRHGASAHNMPFTHGAQAAVWKSISGNQNPSGMPSGEDPFYIEHPGDRWDEMWNQRASGLHVPADHGFQVAYRIAAHGDPNAEIEDVDAEDWGTPQHFAEMLRHVSQAPKGWDLWEDRPKLISVDVPPQMRQHQQQRLGPHEAARYARQYFAAGQPGTPPPGANLSTFNWGSLPDTQVFHGPPSGWQAGNTVADSWVKTPSPAASSYASPSSGGHSGQGPTTGADTHGSILPDTQSFKDSLQKQFPNLTNIGGYRAPDGFNEHSSGHALDVMVPDTATQNTVRDWALKQPNVNYILNQQKQWNPDGSTSPMENRGSPTANHFDHLHVNVADAIKPLKKLDGSDDSSDATDTSPTPMTVARRFARQYFALDLDGHPDNDYEAKSPQPGPIRRPRKTPNPKKKLHQPHEPAMHLKQPGQYKMHSGQRKSGPWLLATHDDMFAPDPEEDKQKKEMDGGEFSGMVTGSRWFTAADPGVSSHIPVPAADTMSGQQAHGTGNIPTPATARQSPTPGAQGPAGGAIGDSVGNPLASSGMEAIRGTQMTAHRWFIAADPDDDPNKPRNPGVGSGQLPNSGTPSSALPSTAGGDNFMGTGMSMDQLIHLQPPAQPLPSPGGGSHGGGGYSGGGAPAAGGGGYAGPAATPSGGPPSQNLTEALTRAGIDPAMHPLIQGFSATEGNNPSGAPTLGFTDSQAGTSLDQHAQALARQIQNRQSVAGPFPHGGSPQDQASWMATVVGQNGVSSDWQGNHQPARSDYVNRIVKSMPATGPSLPSTGAPSPKAASMHSGAAKSGPWLLEASRHGHP